MIDFLFQASALAVLPFWAAMILLPRWSWTEWLVGSPWIILPPIACYLLIAIPHLGEILALFDGATPERLAALLANPWAASLYWTYAGAFDLFVGRWIYFDAREQGINPWLVSPSLFVCILIGPLGFAMYGLTRGVAALPRAVR